MGGWACGWAGKTAWVCWGGAAGILPCTASHPPAAPKAPPAHHTRLRAKPHIPCPSLPSPPLPSPPFPSLPSPPCLPPSPPCRSVWSQLLLQPVGHHPPGRRLRLRLPCAGACHPRHDRGRGGGGPDLHRHLRRLRLRARGQVPEQGLWVRTGGWADACVCVYASGDVSVVWGGVRLPRAASPSPPSHVPPPSPPSPPRFLSSLPAAPP